MAQGLGRGASDPWYGARMSATVRMPRMTREEFLDWAEAQEERYEFDGFQPVAMVGGTANHSQITQNVLFALRTRLRGSGCRPLGPDAGVGTVGNTVRYPDALVTCAKFPGEARLIPGVVVVFEVLSPDSGRRDRIVKLGEYQAVPTILRYVVVEYASTALTVYERASGADAWIAFPLLAGAVLRMPEIGIEVPIDEFYEGVEPTGSGD